MRFRRLHRIAALLLLLLAAAILGPGTVRAGPPKCTCREGNASYDFLNAPVTAADDDSSCPLDRAFPGGCPKKLPKGWNIACASNGKMDCFLRRHAASWRIACSDQLDGKCSCNTPHPEWCPYCKKDGHAWNEAGLEIVKRQIAVERQVLGRRRKILLLKSPHFYLLTDIRSLKIRTREGSPRVIGTHELAHLYIQRAEMAYEDFTRYFGRGVTLSRPMAIYLMDKKGTKEQLQAAYFGSPRTNIVYGGGATRIAGGYPFNGFACSLSESRDDHGLHLQVRHSIGHILMSCWTVVNGQEKYLPRWVYAGSGHWLARLPRKFRERATFCADEGTAIQNNGRNWRMKLLKYAGSSKSVPIQRIFDTNAMSALNLEMHLRAWSWFDLFLEEDRERFVGFLKGLRKGEDHRQALKAAFGCSPEEFDRRWKDRILGRRPSVGATTRELDQSNPDKPGARERASIRTETDLRTLAAKIRSLQAVNDPLTAATVVPLLRMESELVRETIVLVLGRTKSDTVKAWLRTEGLSAQKGFARAYVARVIGNIGDKAAGPELMKFTSDGFWLTRAHVARALGMIGHEPAVPALKEMVKNKSQKVRIAAMDALAGFGEKAGSAWRPVSEQLSARAWQVRSAASDCLGDLGQMAACEPLIARMEIESGRLRRDIRESLKKISRDDLGNQPKYWRDWWDKLKERAGGGIPPRGEKPKEPPKGEHEYGPEPTYYGLRVFSRGIGYVLDISSSMASTIEIAPGWLKRNRRDYPPSSSKYDLAQWEVMASLRSLDPRVRFNLYFFRTTAREWKKAMIQASPSNVGSAEGRLRTEAPPTSPTRSGGNAYQTNYVDVFRLVLDVKRGHDVVGGFGDTPDTIYFLTDGEPTAGDITDPDVLLSWFGELNRFARVKVNVITFGNLGVDAEFLRSLAEDNGGVFVQVPDKR